MDWLEKVLKKAAEDGPLEEGSSLAYVLNDAVVIIELDERRTVKINVSVGEPTRLDISTGL